MYRDQSFGSYRGSSVQRLFSDGLMFSEMEKTKVANDLSCPICKEDLCIILRGDEKVFPHGMVMRTKCDHMAHIKCMNQWKATNPKCPICH